MHPDWLSNAYLVADLDGKWAVYVDSGAPLLPLETFVAIPTPGHSDDHVAFLFKGQSLFSGDVLFKDAVGGGDPDQVRESVMKLMELPPETRVFPGHTDATTIGREWDENPFIRVWRGVDPEGTERCKVGDREGTIVVWSPDYDGKGKAWVRFDDGGGRILGGSRIERL
jgi:hydroxyacylglutathione hydrolase